MEHPWILGLDQSWRENSYRHCTGVSLHPSISFHKWNGFQLMESLNLFKHILKVRSGFPCPFPWAEPLPVV